MAEVKGIKETQEAIVALVTLGKFVADRLKDGIQLDDALALGEKLVLDADFKKIVTDGITGIDQVPAEVQDLSFAEIIELAKVLPELIAIFQK